MIACPTAATLGDLLRSDTPPDLAATLRDHLAGCPSCLATLDRLSNDADLEVWLASSPGVAATTTARRAILAGLGPAESLPLSPELGGATGAGGPPARLGPYEVETEIGRGGMGVVYRARDRTLGRLAAVKVLHPGADDESSRQRFIREVRAAARVEHDHVVRVYATSDPADPILFFAMELLEGESLAGRIRARGRLNPREAAELVSQAARGLAAAHAAGLVHRDVKPDNILIDPATGRAKVGDFGLARLASDGPGPTRDGTVAGTPGYLSPEQARGDPGVGPLADVYALGVTLYESLAGELPFRGTPHRIVHQILHDDPRPPRALNDQVPRDLQTICLKAMDKEPSRRYVDMAEFAADLRHWLDGKPIRARPTGPVGRLGRLARRHPLIATLVLSLALAIAAGVAGVTWQWRRAESNAREAREYLAHALASIDEYFTRVSENRLLDVPNLQPLRKELLTSARDYYEGLLRDRPDDPRLRVELARAGARQATVTSLIGSHDEARSLIDRSLAEFDTILAARPDDLAARDGRIIALVNAADLQFRAARMDDVPAILNRLFATCEVDRRARPGSDVPLAGLYAAHHDRALLTTRRNGPIAEIASDYERAMAANRELLARRPDHLTYLRNESRTAWLLGGVYRVIGRESEARSIFAEGHRAARKLLVEHPDSFNDRYSYSAFETADGLQVFRESLPLVGPAAIARADQARGHLASSLDIMRGLVRDNPQVELYRIDLIDLLDDVATCEAAFGHYQACLALVAEAVAAHAAFRDASNRRGPATNAILILLHLKAQILSQDGRSDEGLAALDEAEAALDAATPSGGVAWEGAELGRATLNAGRAFILCEAGRVAESAPAWGRTIAAVPPAFRPQLELIRDMIFQEDGRGPAVDPRRALSALPVVDVLCSQASQAACANVAHAKVYAMAASVAAEAARDALEARAVLRLEKAAQAGYFRDPARLARVEAHPMLARLRGRRDYAEFLGRAR